MPFCRHFYLGESLLALALFLTASTLPAFAGGAFVERTYADSFGNLVIHSPSGYKRIVVGKGYLADERAQGGYGKPRVVYLEEDRGRVYLREREKCRYGALLHGRSYMYGMPDNLVPVPTVSCR